ncbi:unnamed protein product [Wickerhamomyces anomalus]
MPPKRKTATRSTRRNKKEEEEQDQQLLEEDVPEVEEREGKKKKAEPEPEEKQEQPEKELTKENIEPEAEPALSSISSRIPSPVKKHPLGSNKPDLEFKKTEQAINQNFVSKNLPKLSSIIDDLKSSKADALFDELKSSTETRFKTSDDLINSLTSRNQQLSIELEELRGRLSELENNPNGDVQPIANEEESFQNELILDMMEQIVGLRIHSVEDTDEALSFDCSQSGKNGVLDYKLTIPKEDSSEIIYTPVNKEESNDLKKYLPEYFFDDLTFPIDTVSLIY